MATVAAAPKSVTACPRKAFSSMSVGGAIVVICSSKQSMESPAHPSGLAVRLQWSDADCRETAIPAPQADPMTTTGDPVTLFLDAVAGGSGVPTDIYAPGAVLDATVPNWRLEAHGPAAISGQLSGFYAH